MIYIECYDINEQQILGTMDGQSVIRTANYRRTTSYRRVIDIIKLNAKYPGISPSRTRSARIVYVPDDRPYQSPRLLETITTNLFGELEIKLPCPTSTGISLSSRRPR